MLPGHIACALARDLVQYCSNAELEVVRNRTYRRAVGVALQLYYEKMKILGRYTAVEVSGVARCSLGLAGFLGSCPRDATSRHESLKRKRGS
jgi:hypothetical protein